MNMFSFDFNQESSHFSSYFKQKFFQDVIACVENGCAPAHQVRQIIRYSQKIDTSHWVTCLMNKTLLSLDELII